jgi:hypothetical protein
MLLKWAGWRRGYFTLEKMNQWVYDGFATYKI